MNINEKCDFENYIAKTFKDDDGNIFKGRSVLEHCIIVGEVCKALISQMPEKLKKFFNNSTPFLASLHDIGKVSPTFQNKISKNIDNHPLKDELVNINSELEKNWGGHAGAGEITLEYIKDNLKLDFHRREYKYLPLIAGLHHGFKSNIDETLATDECLGNEYWNNLRINHFEKLKDYFECSLEPLNNDTIATINIGLTIVSDWIGSSEIFDNPSQPYLPLIDKAIENTGFKSLSIKKGQSFEDIFSFKPRKSQEELIKICDREGVYILEAPMGVGKTEAALYCAYKILEKGLARGIYFALPTQITSNKIYYRFKPFIKKISENDETIKLLHSNSEIYQLGSDADIGASWFDSAKRGLLAPFAVGTIDQALMAVMNVKHYPVRAFGLFGKVVILDEVHSYDTYTGTILDELVKKLKNMGCTVIILSATLTKERKEEIANINSVNNYYPLVTAYKDDKLYEKEVEYNDNKEVEIEYLNTENAISEAIEAALSGLQVLWVENTVNKAQEIYTSIKRMTNIECGLIHSRFIKKDRKDIEDNWVEIFSHTNENRYNNGRILIGTQVLEQSIDIDADILITRHAPIDFLLQRIGRLHRHNIRRINNIKPKCIIIENDKTEYSNYVYSPYVLERTKEILVNKNKLSIPKDIRSLIEDTYKDRDNNDEKEKLLLKYKDELEKTKEKLKNLASYSLTKLSKAIDDNNAILSTRYCEQDNISVLIIKAVNENKITFLDNSSIDLSNRISYNERCKVSIKISENILSISEKYAPKKINTERSIINKLKEYIYIDKDCAYFRIAIVDEVLNIVGLDRQDANNKYELKYIPNIGYKCTKKEQCNG